MLHFDQMQHGQIVIISTITNTHFYKNISLELDDIFYFAYNTLYGWKLARSYTCIDLVFKSWAFSYILLIDFLFLCKIQTLHKCMVQRRCMWQFFYCYNVALMNYLLLRIVSITVAISSEAFSGKQILADNSLT